MRVAIVDPLPAYRAGVASSLRNAGYLPEEVAGDPAAWAQRDDIHGALVTVEGPSEVGLVREVRDANDALIIVALSSQLVSAHLNELLDLGCHAVVDRGAHPDLASIALTAAVHGHMVVPSHVPVALARCVVEKMKMDLSSQHVEWLAALAAGHTISDLARQAGYSPRAMHRKLQTVYRALGTRDRVSALMAAARLGVI
ncbi:hypothetical protein AB0I81_17765 [Nonomuraea sp. NPDC050404]|uniref:hypothetical protein n=1 Tax=Nonomuraea sp. NPDC050404 TaxID=3155783 RepID=UPI003405AD6C